jgi:chromosomal replication initiation ATPase DnaA
MCKLEAIATDGAVWLAGQQALLAQMAVAEVLGVRLTALCGQERGDVRAAFARQTAMYLCRLAFDMRLNDIAMAFGRDRTTAAHAVRRIEEAREDPEFDRCLAWLEAALQRAGGFHG